MLKRKFVKLELMVFLKRLSVKNVIKLPRLQLHKSAALIMLIPFILQPMLQDIFVIEKFEFSIPNMFNRIPVLDQFDLSYIPFVNNEFVIEHINYSVLILLPIFLFAVLISQWLVRKTVPRQTVHIVEDKNTNSHQPGGLHDLN